MLMKMVYNDKYSIVDENMSDSNVGSRKGKNVRNHIFVLNRVINEAVNQKNPGIDLKFWTTSSVLILYGLKNA